VLDNEDDMSITNTNSVSTLPTTITKQNTASAVGQADFLKLLTVQMKNQDPMKPTDNNAFIAQMAQFSQLNALEDIKKTSAELSIRLHNIDMASALNFVGKSVQVDDEDQARRVVALIAKDGGAPLLQLDDARAVPLARISALSF